MEMTLASAGSRAVRLEPACTRLPKTARHPRGFAETRRNIAEVSSCFPGAVFHFFSQDERSACSPCLTKRDTGVPLQPSKRALPCLTPQLRDTALILTKKGDDSIKNEEKKESYLQRSFSLHQSPAASASPSPETAQSDPSSHKRIAGPGTGLLLDTSCPLPRYIPAL